MKERERIVQDSQCRAIDESKLRRSERARDGRTCDSTIVDGRRSDEINPRKKRKRIERIPSVATRLERVTSHVRRASPACRTRTARVRTIEDDFQLTDNSQCATEKSNVPGRILTHKHETSVGNHVAMANRGCVVITDRTLLPSRGRQRREA